MGGGRWRAVHSGQPGSPHFFFVWGGNAAISIGKRSDAVAHSLSSTLWTSWLIAGGCLGLSAQETPRWGVGVVYLRNLSGPQSRTGDTGQGCGLQGNWTFLAQPAIKARVDATVAFLNQGNGGVESD
jgi:hypothetical protein